MMRTSHQD
jgi:hypothetical protein